MIIVSFIAIFTMPSSKPKRNEEASSYPRPWWLDEGDDDLQRTSYADEASPAVDDERMSTGSFPCVDDTRGRTPRSSRRGESCQRASQSSPATPRQTSSAGSYKFKHAVDYFKRQITSSGKEGDAGGKSGSAVFNWNCEACTYLNVKDVEQPPRENPIPDLTCAVCGTPHLSPLETYTTNASVRINTVSPDSISRNSVGTIERTLPSHQEKGNDSADVEEIRPGHTGSRSRGSIPARAEIFSSSRNFKKQKLSVYQQKRQKGDIADTAIEQSTSGHTQGQNQSDGISESSLGTNRQYSVSELIASLGDNDVELPPALERRVRDFKFAQAKRRELHGDKKPWGIYGLYDHLSDIRADLEWAEDAAWRRQRGQPYLSWKDFEKSRDRGLHNRPLFTYGILFLCTIMTFVTFGVNGWKFEPLNVNPLFGPSPETLIRCGARDTNLIVNERQWYRLFTPMILHAGLVHFFVNMLALYFIGGAVEQSHGFASAAVLFIIPGVGGNILSAICLPQYISVGASGGIFGMIGGCIADICLNWNLLFLKSTTDGNTRNRHFLVLFWLGLDVVVNCLLGFTPLVDNFTHL
jgi:membrane associated rhomboid family serine protease